MKYLIFVLLTQILAYGKVQDFNSIINEDIRAQKELHNQLNKQVNKEALAQKDQAAKTQGLATQREVVVVENTTTNYVAPSNKNFLKFNKEIRQKSQNSRKNDHRVAKEIKELGM